MSTVDVTPSQSEPLNIYSCSDDNYARHLGVLITSIKENMGNESIVYWIISNNISDTNKNKLKQIESDKLKINIVDFDKNIDYLSVTIKKYSNINLSSYMRLFVSDYIPEDVMKILYLDADMICRGSLKELFDVRMDNCCISGVRDVIAAQCCHRLNVPHYINAGALLINLKLWRSIDAQTRILDYISANLGNKQKLLYHDQDALNCSLSEYIQYIDHKWNSLTGAGELEYKQVLMDQSKDGIILHLLGKPWVKGEWNQFTGEYARYLAMSPWSEENVQISKKKCSFRWRVFNYSLSLAQKIEKRKLLWKLSNYIYKQGYKQGLETYLLMQFDVTSAHSTPSQYILCELEKIADTHNALAMVRLARAYLFGWGVEKDFTKSMAIYCSCIEQGDVWVTKELQQHKKLISDQWGLLPDKLQTQLTNVVQPD